MNSVKEALLRCSFCGKTQEEVKKIIAGPTVYICDECIDLCNDIMEEEYQNEHADEFQKELLKPAEIKDVLDNYVVGQDRPKRCLQLQFTIITSGSKLISINQKWNCRKAIFC
jgi:ATP-dependent Clp protease ATP-binding subunit ClpX